ncbi:MAG: ABC transporter permease subunit [Planctomycetota bacterium]
MCLFMGVPLIARDLKVGAMEVYFSKPILLIDYVIGKFSVIAFFLGCVTLVPSLFIFFTDILLAEKEGHFMEAVKHLPGIFAVSVFMITTCSVLVMASSALSRTARTAAIIWFGFHMALFIVSKISAEIFSNRNLELIDPQTSLRFLSESWFGLHSAYTWNTSIPFLYLLFFICASLWIIFRRVKGVEVVK